MAPRNKPRRRGGATVSTPANKTSGENRTQENTNNTAPPPPPQPPGTTTPTFDDKPEGDEVTALVCDLLCQGYLPPEIPQQLLKMYGIQLNRNGAYPHINKAANNNWFCYSPPIDFQLRQALMKRYPRLADVVVAKGPGTRGVTHRAAQMIGGLIGQVYTDKLARAAAGQVDGVHLGLSGGYTLMLLCRDLVNHLVQAFIQLSQTKRDKGRHGQPGPGFPGLLHFHAMVAGFDPHDPTTEPNAMFAYLNMDNQAPFGMKFVGFNAPPVVRHDQIDANKKLPFIRAAYEEAHKIDIVVTSMGVWDDKDCMLRRCMTQFPEDFSRLEDAGVIGDVLWQPIGEDGPMSSTSDVRTMTVMELNELGQLIRRGGKVVLVVGPCRSGCSKTRALRRLLAFKPGLVSHLVVDSMTARELLT